jgi:hypothetical protein
MAAGETNNAEAMRAASTPSTVCRIRGVRAAASIAGGAQTTRSFSRSSGKCSRSRVNREYQERVCETLDATAKQKLFGILTRPSGEPRSLWDKVKREPKRLTVANMKDFLDHLRWLQQQNVAASAFASIPDAKVKQFAAEARSLDLASLNDMPERKRLTLVAALILKQVARSLDDAAEMFIRQVQKMHNRASDALVLYRAAHAERTDTLVARLREIALAYKAEGTREQRLAAIEMLLAADADNILALCDAHGAVAGNNYLSFLPSFYSGRRGALFLFLENIPLASTTHDKSVTGAIAFLLAHKATRSDWLPIIREEACKDGLPSSRSAWVSDISSSSAFASVVILNAGVSHFDFNFEFLAQIKCRHGWSFPLCAS